MIPETRLIVLFDKEELMNSSIEGGGNQYDGRAKDNGESFIETEPLPQMKYNMWEERNDYAIKKPQGGNVLLVAYKQNRLIKTSTYKNHGGQWSAVATYR